MKEKETYDITPMRARLMEYLRHESLNNKGFEERCGLYNGFVRAMDSKITFESLAKIGAPESASAKAAPSVNMENVQAVFITNVDAIASAVAKVLGSK